MAPRLADEEPDDYGRNLPRGRAPRVSWLLDRTEIDEENPLDDRSQLENRGHEVEDISAPDRPPLIRRTFRNRFGHWRAGWRLMMYLVAVLVIGESLSAAFKTVVAGRSGALFTSWTHSLLWLFASCGLIAGALVLLRWFDRRPGALLGLGFSSGWLREIGVGLVAGVGATGLLVAILTVTRSVSLVLSPQLAESLWSLPRYLFIFLVAAAAEELIFRGYPLQVLAEGSRRWIAGALLCVVFTMGHGGNPDLTGVGILNIFLASVVLTLLYFRTRRLWMPIALHLSWNFAQSWLWGFDVSGIKIEDQLLVMMPTNVNLVTGGEFGLEGSILSTILFGAVAVWLLVRPVLRPTAEVATLWARYPAGFGLDPEVLSDEVRGSEMTSREGDSDTTFKR